MKITVIGGGSFTWSFGFVRQFVDSEHLKDVKLVLCDINRQALEITNKAATIYNNSQGSPVRIETTTDTDAALDGADFVLVSISTGGLEAMRHDIEIPEKYGIWHTVGDTVGPGGWSRAARNIPVFDDLAARMKKLCPNAWLLNVTNPLSVLTRICQRNHGIKTIGLCHGVEDQVRTLARVTGFDEISPSAMRKGPNCEFSFSCTGIDHGSFFLSLYADGVDILAKLKEMGFCRGNGKLPGTVQTEDPMAKAVTNKIIFEIWYTLGYLPTVADRHIIENYPNYLVSETGRLRPDIKRTSIADRQKRLAQCRALLEKYIANKDSASLAALGQISDPVVKVIEALCRYRTFLLCSNYMNVGQIPQLPAGAVVETRCVFDAAGVHPLCSPMPDILKPIVAPHVWQQECSIDIILNGSFNDFVSLVMTDPLYSGLSIKKCREMTKEMLDANKTFIKNPRLLEF
jgi:alpha-galactosidase/6-phospho-beta-glucosidase family protein